MWTVADLWWDKVTFLLNRSRCGGSRSHSYWTGQGVGQGNVLQVWSWSVRARSCSYETVQCVLGQGRVLAARLKVWLGKVMFLRDGSRCDGARSCSNGTVQGARSCSYGTVRGVVGQGHVLTEPFKVWWHKVMFLQGCSRCGGVFCYAGQRSHNGCTWRAQQQAVS